jgi:hypothetical protein
MILNAPRVLCIVLPKCVGQAVPVHGQVVSDDRLMVSPSVLMKSIATTMETTGIRLTTR